MSDLIIEGAKGIPDGLYVIKDGLLFKYKPNGGTARAYHVTDRPRGEWINTAPSDRSDNIICDQCGYNSIARYDYCPNCGSDNRGEDE